MVRRAVAAQRAATYKVTTGGTQINSLGPYSPPPAPLTAGARFIRGFTRIGAAIAVLVVLIGLPVSIIIAINNYNSAADNHRGAECIARLARSGHTFKKKYEYSSAIDYGVGGCSHYYSFEYRTVTEVMAIADAPEPTFLTDGASALGIGLIVTGVLAVIAYMGFWLIGWLCAGFTRDA